MSKRKLVGVLALPVLVLAGVLGASNLASAQPVQNNNQAAPCTPVFTVIGPAIATQSPVAQVTQNSCQAAQLNQQQINRNVAAPQTATNRGGEQFIAQSQDVRIRVVGATGGTGGGCPTPCGHGTAAHPTRITVGQAAQNNQPQTINQVQFQSNANTQAGQITQSNPQRVTITQPVTVRDGAVAAPTGIPFP